MAKMIDNLSITLKEPLGYTQLEISVDEDITYISITKSYHEIWIVTTISLTMKEVKQIRKYFNKEETK